MFPRKGSSVTFATSKRDMLAEAVNDTRFSKVVRRHLKLDPISRCKADESLPHFSRDVSEHEMLISKLNAEHGSR
jgi:hypothetical protein